MFNKSPIISIQVSASTDHTLKTMIALKFEQKRAYENETLYLKLLPETAIVCDLFICLNFRLFKGQVSKSDANSRGSARVKTFRSKEDVKVQRSRSSCDNSRPASIHVF